MLKSLRRKFILIAMSSMALVLAVLMTIINITNYININRTADTLLGILAENEGSFPKEHSREGLSSNFSRYYYRDRYNISAEAAYNTRYFTVSLTEDGTVKSINTGRVSVVSPTAASKIANSLWKEHSNEGYWDIYKYRRIDLSSPLPEDPPKYMYIFLDCDQYLKTFREFLWASISVSVIGLLVVFLLVYIFSGKTLKPVAESYEKQKRFITDASHDIKTPLTIIDANTEILEMTSGENEWTRSIRNQISRLTDLTEKLVFLSRMDEENSKLMMYDFSLSDTVTEIAEPFLAIAKTKDLTFTMQIDPNITYHGSEDKLRQLVSLLLDNAFKYVSESGKISLKLTTSGRNKILTLWNTVDHIEKGNQDRLFDRFYRRDASRNQAISGHGIGLSVALAIVLAHKGRISAKSEDGASILFTVTL